MLHSLKRARWKVILLEAFVVGYLHFKAHWSTSISKLFSVLSLISFSHPGVSVKMPKLRSPVSAKIKLFHLTEPKNECLVLSRYPHSAGIIGLTGFKLFLEVGSLPCFESFLSSYSGLPLSAKSNISKFKDYQESGRRRTTEWMCYL